MLLFRTNPIRSIPLIRCHIQASWVNHPTTQPNLYHAAREYILERLEAKGGKTDD